MAIELKSGLFCWCISFILGENAKPDGYEITYNVRESRRVTGGISTLVGTNDGSVVSMGQMQGIYV